MNFNGLIYQRFTIEELTDKLNQLSDVPLELTDPNNEDTDDKGDYMKVFVLTNTLGAQVEEFVGVSYIEDNKNRLFITNIIRFRQ